MTITSINSYRESKDKLISASARKYPTVSDCTGEYQLIEDARYDWISKPCGDRDITDWYAARAIRIDDDVIDVNGIPHMATYEVRFDILDEYRASDAPAEEDACDWDSPASIKDDGGMIDLSEAR